MLRNIITSAAELHGKPLKDLTVLSEQRDPFRIDTPNNHMLGQWLRDALLEVGHTTVGTRIHARGIHYLLVGAAIKPDGKPYINDAKHWVWLQEKVLKAARYLDYLPWTSVRDARNAAPISYMPEFDAPRWRLRAGEVELFLPASLAPRFEISGDLARQPWMQVLLSEKQGIIDVATPVCKRRQAVLATPSGEVSDQMVHDLMDMANDQGRPIVFHQLGDADPAGHQMAISTARTVQALCASKFFDLKARVHAVALTPQQAAEWDLPESVIKDTELRAGAWMEATGREQTEIDSAVARAPAELAKVIDDSLLQYYDPSLRDRAALRRAELEAEANERLAETLGGETLNKIRAAVEGKLEELEELTAIVNAALAVDPDDVDIEEPKELEVMVGETACRNEPLLDTRGDWAEQTERLIRRKRYDDI